MRKLLIAAVFGSLVPLTALALADGKGPGQAQKPPLEAGASQAPKTPPEAGSQARIPPDPAPLSERKQWVFDLRWDRGEVYLVGVHALDLGAPQATPRAMGRFALELYEGPTLIERARFDFPLMAGQADGGPDALAAKLKTRIGVLFPATRRGTKLELWDRATDRRWTLPWPPAEPEVAAPHDGGTDQ